MTYRGRMQNGVIVFAAPVPIAEGAEVDVRHVATSHARRGSAEAVLRNVARWAGPPEKMDRLLREVQEMREQDFVD